MVPQSTLARVLHTILPMAAHNNICSDTGNRQPVGGRGIDGSWKLSYRCLWPRLRVGNVAYGPVPHGFPQNQKPPFGSPLPLP